MTGAGPRIVARFAAAAGLAFEVWRAAHIFRSLLPTASGARKLQRASEELDEARRQLSILDAERRERRARRAAVVPAAQEGEGWEQGGAAPGGAAAPW